MELNTKIHMVVDAHDMPIRFLVTAGTRGGQAPGGAVCTKTKNLYKLRHMFEKIFCEIKNGGVWLLDFRKIQHHVLSPYKLGACFFSLKISWRYSPGVLEATGIC